MCLKYKQSEFPKMELIGLTFCETDKLSNTYCEKHGDTDKYVRLTICVCFRNKKLNGYGA